MFHPITQEHLVGYRQSQMLKEAERARLIRQAMPASEHEPQTQLQSYSGSRLWEFGRRMLRFAPARG